MRGRCGQNDGIIPRLTRTRCQTLWIVDIGDCPNVGVDDFIRAALVTQCVEAAVITATDHVHALAFEQLADREPSGASNTGPP
jgi:hypothetical protein